MNEIYNFHPEYLSDEQFAELKKIVLVEEEKRRKAKEYEVVLNLRNALREFMDSEAWIEYSCSVQEECEIVECSECNTADGDEYAQVYVDVFDNDVLRGILNELTRCLGDY